MNFTVSHNTVVLWHIGPQGEFPKAPRCYSPSQVAEGILLSWLGVTELPVEHRGAHSTQSCLSVGRPGRPPGGALPLMTENEEVLSSLSTCQQKRQPHLAGVATPADLDCQADFGS